MRDTVTSQLDKRAPRVRTDTILGRVRFCNRCFTWQPDDHEFWIKEVRKAGGQYIGADKRTHVRRTVTIAMKCRSCTMERIRLSRERAAHLREQQRAYKPVKVVLGPAPCHDCRVPLYWNGNAWFERRGNRHVCAVETAHPFDYNSASGSGAESNSLSPDTRVSATTRDAGVVASIEVVAR